MKEKDPFYMDPKPKMVWKLFQHLLFEFKFLEEYGSKISREEFIFLFFKFYVLYVVWITALLFFLIGSILVIIDFPNQSPHIYEEEFLKQWNAAQGFWDHFLLWNFHGLVLGLILGLIGGLVLGLLWGLVGGLILGLGGSLVLGLIEGIGVGLGLGLGVGLVGGLLLGLIGGLIGGLGGGLVWSLVESFIKDLGVRWEEIKEFFFSSSGIPLKFFFLAGSFYLGYFRFKLSPLRFYDDYTKKFRKIILTELRLELYEKLEIALKLPERKNELQEITRPSRVVEVNSIDVANQKQNL